MIKELLQKIKQPKVLMGMSLNENGSKKVRTTIVTVIFSGALALRLYFLIFTEDTPKKSKFQKTAPSNFARIADPTFSEEDNHSAITDQQVQINNLKNKISDQSKYIEDLLKSIFPFCYGDLSKDRQKSRTRHRVKSTNIANYIPMVADYKGALDTNKESDLYGHCYGLITPTATINLPFCHLFSWVRILIISCLPELWVLANPS